MNQTHRRTTRKGRPARKKAAGVKRGGAILKTFVVMVIAAAFAAATGYIVYADRYEGRFIEGTVINNNDVGGKDLAEAENILVNSSDYRLEIDFKDGSAEWISGESISLGYDYGSGIEQVLSSQDKYRWIEGALGETRSYTIDNGVHYDEDQLQMLISSLPQFAEEVQVSPTNARCVRSAENTFVIEPENEGNRIKAEVAFACIRDAIRQQKRYLNLSETDAYERPTVTADDPGLNEKVAQLNRFLETTVIYDLPDGSQWIVDRNMLTGWIAEDGTDYYINEDMIRGKCDEAAATLASLVDDVHTSRVFYATDGREVTFESNTYGRQMDRASESASLAENVLNYQSAEREPAYLMNSYPESLNDGTYIEVDLADQMVYLYKDGSLFYDTPCVSGLSDDPERITITGIFKIQVKDRDRTLKGKPDENGVPAYQSFVSYWMGFSGAYGLHDATWRDEFGGDIYEYGGSHGCVNLPYSAAETIYNNVEEGTRVIVY